MIVVNFKTYESATGNKALHLAKTCEEAAKETDIDIIAAVQAIDVERVSREVSIPIFAQHVDGVEYGAHTGSILPEAVKAAGAKGSLVNHAEHRIKIDEIEKSVKRMKDVGLQSIVCASDEGVAYNVAKTSPNYVAIEWPELIGTLISISKAKPEAITKTIKNVRKVSDVPVLAGAGIANGGDVKKALELGCTGILLATAVTKAKDPKAKLLDLASGFQ